MSRLTALLAASALAMAPATAAADDTSIWSVIKAKMTEAAAKADDSATSKSKDSNTRLGLEIVPVTPDLRAHYGSTDGRGVLVGHVDVGSPAQLAGIKVGDLLLELGGKSIATGADVVSALASAGSNRTLRATVLRNHKRQEVTVYLDQPLPILGELVRMFTIPQPTCT